MPSAESARSGVLASPLRGRSRAWARRADRRRMLLDALQALQEARRPGRERVAQGGDTEERVGVAAEHTRAINEHRTGWLRGIAPVVGDHVIGDADCDAQLLLGEAEGVAKRPPRLGADGLYTSGRTPKFGSARPSSQMSPVILTSSAPRSCRN